MEAKKVNLTLELNVAQDSLSGSASNGTGIGRPFTGWLGLIRTIDALVGEHDPADGASTDPKGDSWPPAS